MTEKNCREVGPGHIHEPTESVLERLQIKREDLLEHFYYFDYVFGVHFSSTFSYIDVQDVCRAIWEEVEWTKKLEIDLNEQF